jgi:hypothetical protein
MSDADNEQTISELALSRRLSIDARLITFWVCQTKIERSPETARTGAAPTNRLSVNYLSI